MSSFISKSVCGVLFLVTLSGIAYGQHGRGGSGGSSGGGRGGSGARAPAAHRPATPAAHRPATPAAHRPATQPTHRPATQPTHRSVVSPNSPAPRTSRSPGSLAGGASRQRPGSRYAPGTGGGSYAPAGGEEPEPSGVSPEAARAAYGVRITQLFDGTAATQGLRLDDIILSFNDTPTPTFEALRDAVQQSGSQAEVIFLNGENGQREAITLYPVNGLIGVLGVAVQVE
jgi:hypothetical protein